MENLLMIIIFLFFLFSSLLGKKKTPQKGGRPKSTSRKKPTEQAEPRQESVDPDDEFFPIPDDLREIFGLPPLKKKKKEEVKTGHGEEKVVVSSPVAPDYTVPERETPDKSFPTIDSKKEQLKPVLSLDSKSVAQGVIWAEVLNNPRFKNPYRMYRR